MTPEQTLAELRRELTGAPPDAMARMRQTVLERTAHPTRPSSQRRRAILVTATGGLATGVAAAVVIGTGAVDVRGHHHPVATHRHHPAVPPSPSQVPVTDAPTLLYRVAQVAGGSTADVRDNQFLYLKERLVMTEQGRGTTEGTDKSWLSVDGSVAGWTIDTGKDGKPEAYPLPLSPASIDNPTYHYLTTLPTDPDQLLAQIRAFIASKPADKVLDADQFAFDVIGDLLRLGVLPPRLAAALYQAAARIPGVTLARNVVDAAGRHGIGVQRTSDRIATLPRSTNATTGGYSAYQEFWIFDPVSFEYLGQNSQSRDRTTRIAILTRGVVDKVRQEPR
jgi:hypothetical protein